MKKLFNMVLLTGLMVTSISAQAWWGSANNWSGPWNNGYSGSPWNNSPWNNSNWGNPWGGMNNVMGDMMGDMVGDFEITISVRGRGYGSGDSYGYGRGYGYPYPYYAAPIAPLAPQAAPQASAEK